MVLLLCFVLFGGGSCKGRGQKGGDGEMGEVRLYGVKSTKNQLKVLVKNIIPLKIIPFYSKVVSVGI